MRLEWDTRRSVIESSFSEVCMGAFASLDGVDLKDRFKFRACMMCTVPNFMKGAFRLGLRAALEEVLAGFSQRSDVRVEVIHALAEDDASQKTTRR